MIQRVIQFELVLGRKVYIHGSHLCVNYQTIFQNKIKIIKIESCAYLFKHTLTRV